MGVSPEREKNTMSRKVWISFPLITASEINDAAVVSFLRGGLKKELEVETATFLTKWLMDKGLPYRIDFNSAPVDRNLVLAALPKRLQKVLGVTVPAATEVGEVAAVGEVLQAGAPAPVEDAVAVEQAVEVVEVAVESTAGEAGAGGPSEAH
jgi:hypothetical protein